MRPHVIHIPRTDASTRVDQSTKVCHSSRDGRPDGSLPTFAWSDVSTPIRTITARHSLSPRSFTHCGITRPCGRACPVLPRDATLGLPCSAHGAESGGFRLSAGGLSISVLAPSKPTTDHLPFGQSDVGKPTQSISLFQLDGIYQRFAYANPLTQPSAFPGFRLPGSHDHPHGRSCPVRGLHCQCA